ncbi:DNA-binding transcriptional regulator, GntR family [Methylobacterium sp. ap11]|jgi:DNA-binding GntR family transcriptional regulator|uniref:GntR family transcriptional regulator n=1 Tax=Methylobacterium sp. ap11 TaxID=1761799 RepID=UPI0008C0D263|nr:GntR family transcriptional regulator [Methylobacterium sp. ap11]SEP49123.1 DNA-binding transcriptional regulator, GntR family [Methylobacterium sp. ap11]
MDVTSEDTGHLAKVVPVSRRTLHDDLVGQIRDLIIEGELAPETRIHEGQLGQALGVSRTPLREALKFLASEGLIELVPGRGAVVRRLTPRDVRDMMDVLAALETTAARLACRRATEAEIAALRRLHDEMMAFYASRQRLEYYKRNQAIHAAIAALSGNAFLAATHEGIQSRLRRIRFVGNEEPRKWAGAVAEHEEMIAALEARDADRLAEVIARHLDATWDRVQDVL